MDPLTQGALGAVAAAAVVGRKLPRSAWAIGLLGGMAADLDVLIRVPGDPMLSVAMHRHFTHALAFIPVSALFAYLILLPFRSRLPDRRLGPAVAAATIGYATHGLLDACTSYGTLIAWPFSNARVAWDCMSIIDPIFTLLLLAGLLWHGWSRRIAPVRIALILSLVYIGLGVAQQQRGQAAQATLAASRGHTVERGRVMPTIGNLIVWRSVYEHDGRLWIDALRLSPFSRAQFRPGDNVPLASLQTLTTTPQQPPQPRAPQNNTTLPITTPHPAATPPNFATPRTTATDPVTHPTAATTPAVATTTPTSPHHLPANNEAHNNTDPTAATHAHAVTPTTADTPHQWERSLRLFAWFADGYIAHVPDTSTLADMRYGSPPQSAQPLWGMRFTGNNRTVGMVSLSRPNGRMLADLWRDIVSPHLANDPWQPLPTPRITNTLPPTPLAAP